jgi:hypothetical protein
VDNWKKLTNSQNSVKKKSFGGTFSSSNCHIIGLDNGSLVLIVFGRNCSILIVDAMPTAFYCSQKLFSGALLLCV